MIYYDVVGLLGFLEGDGEGIVVGIARDRMGGKRVVEQCLMHF
jgi:hypothetical protein